MHPVRHFEHVKCWLYSLKGDMSVNLHMSFSVILISENHVLVATRQKIRKCSEDAGGRPKSVPNRSDLGRIWDAPPLAQSISCSFAASPLRHGFRPLNILRRTCVNGPTWPLWVNKMSISHVRNDAQDAWFKWWNGHDASSPEDPPSVLRFAASPQRHGFRPLNIAEKDICILIDMATLNE